ncbi:MAG: CvpA family protein [Planctomycetota bacterium]
MYITIAAVIFFATLAMMVQQGIWSNLITTMAIVLGGLAAFGLHQPLVIMLDEQTDGSYTYLLDFPVLWLIFALVTGLIKEIAGRLSKNRVNFPDQIDNYGGAGVGVIGAYVMMAFAMATFHAAPLSYDALSGNYEYGVTPAKAESKLSEAGTFSPGAAWLRLTESALSPEAFGNAGFSAKIFISQHGKHRKTFESLKTTAVKRR